ncbi:MAG: hypothetical protein EHM24_27240, partial [Acidobacteria bacterium]
MPITRSTAAQRSAATRTPRGRGRGIELLALLAASLVSLAGLALVYQVKAQGNANVDADLGKGRLVHLNQVDRPEPLVPLLERVLGDPGERRFVAQRIASWLSSDGATGHRRINSVSAISSIRVSKGALPNTRSLPSIRERLAGSGADSVALLGSAQLAAIRPFLVVRRPADFTRAVAWAAALFLLPFYVAHVWLRFRAPDADQLLLPGMHLLTGIGLAMMIGLRDPLRETLLFTRFAQGVAAGLVVLSAAATVDFQRSGLRRLSYVPLLAAMGLSVLLVAFGTGPGTSDAKV